MKWVKKTFFWTLRLVVGLAAVVWFFGLIKPANTQVPGGGGMFLTAFLVGIVGTLALAWVFISKFLTEKKPQPTPTAPPGNNQTRTATKKKSGLRTFIWVVVVAIAAAGIYQAVSNWNNFFPEKKYSTLDCNSGRQEKAADTRYVKVGPGTTIFVVPPDSCWTATVYRPSWKGQLSPKFLVEVSAEIEIQFGYGKDAWDEPYITYPDDNSVFTGVTRVRLRNSSDKPVMIAIITS